MGKKKGWSNPAFKRQNRPLAVDTLEIARQDIEAARLLYDAQLYPQAVYFLQQGVEKGWKSFGFQYGIIDEPEAQNPVSHTPSEVSHKSCALLQKIVNSHLGSFRKVKQALGQDLETINEDLAYLGDLEVQTVWAIGELENIKNDPYRYKSIPQEQFDEIVAKCHDYERGLGIINELLKDREFSDEVYAEIRWGAKKTLQKMLWGIPFKRRLLHLGLNQFQKEELDNLIKVILNGMVIFEPLLHLAIITQPHESLTRYASSKENGYSPIRAYTQDNYLIQRFEDLQTICASTLEHLASLYQMMPEKWPSNPVSGGMR